MKAILTILCVVMLVKTGLAQSCTGSAGDPIVNITFGAGTDKNGRPLSAGVTNLTYNSSDCPSDGEYTITNQTTACFSNTWYPLTDHTGDANGYLMLINASYQPSDFYVQTIDNLCAETNFRFSVWIANICNVWSATLPNVVVTIEKTDGTLLGSYSTGDIPATAGSAKWKEYGFNFIVPQGTSTVVLRMHNGAAGGLGNDLAIDDITFRPIGPKVSIASFGIPDDSISLCTSDSRNFMFRSNVEKCYTAIAYQWQVSINDGTSWTDIAGANQPDFTRMPTSAGRYLYRLSVAQSENIGSVICRVVSNPFKIIVHEENVRTISISKPDGNICEDAPVTFKASTTYAGNRPSFQWMLNSAPVTDAVDSVYTTTGLSSGDRVECYFKSSLTCNDPLTSNDIPVTVLIKARNTVDIAICEGENYGGHTTTGTYTDNFPGSNGCDSLRTVNLTVYRKEYSSFDTSICYGTSYSGLTKSGTYHFIYPSAHGCDSIHTVYLEVLPDINTKAHTDTFLCTGNVITLSPGAFDTYKWQDGSATESYRIENGGSYSVQVANKCGIATKTFNVQEQVCIVSFPSAFSPNGDGRNDIFRVVNRYNISRFHFAVFNRWGQKMFESANPQQGWDGTIGSKKADEGVYLWFCDYSNRNEPEEKISLKGTIVLIR